MKRTLMLAVLALAPAAGGHGEGAAGLKGPGSAGHDSFGTLHFDPAPWVCTTPFRVAVISAADGKKVAASEGRLRDLALPPGAYRIVWRQSEHRSTDIDLGETVEIKPGETAVLRLSTGIHFSPAKWLKEPPYYWLLKDPSSGREVVRAKGTWDAMPAPAGTYELRYRQWEHGSSEVCLSRDLQIVKGKRTEVLLITGIGIGSRNPNASPPYKCVLKDTTTGEETVAISGTWGSVPLPPGMYRVSIQQTERGSPMTVLEPDLVISPGQHAEIDL